MKYLTILLTFIFIVGCGGDKLLVSRDAGSINNYLTISDVDYEYGYTIITLKSDNKIFAGTTTIKIKGYTNKLVPYDKILIDFEWFQQEMYKK
jgi:hypothetical protein